MEWARLRTLTIGMMSPTGRSWDFREVDMYVPYSETQLFLYSLATAMMGTKRALLEKFPQ